MNKNPMTDPMAWIIYLHEWLKFMVNVGKYTSPMDPMGMLRGPVEKGKYHRTQPLLGYPAGT